MNNLIKICDRLKLIHPLVQNSVKNYGINKTIETLWSNRRYQSVVYTVLFGSLLSRLIEK